MQTYFTLSLEEMTNILTQSKVLKYASTTRWNIDPDKVAETLKRIVEYLGKKYVVISRDNMHNIYKHNGGPCEDPDIEYGKHLGTCMLVLPKTKTQTYDNTN